MLNLHLCQSLFSAVLCPLFYHLCSAFKDTSASPCCYSLQPRSTVPSNTSRCVFLTAFPLYPLLTGLLYSWTVHYVTWHRGSPGRMFATSGFGIIYLVRQIFFYREPFFGIGLFIYRFFILRKTLNRQCLQTFLSTAFFLSKISILFACHFFAFLFSFLVLATLILFCVNL